MLTIVKQVELRPLRTGASAYSLKTYYEQVLLTVEGYPSMLFHIDTLYNMKNREDNDLYKKLESGEPIKCRMIFEMDENL